MLNATIARPSAVIRPEAQVDRTSIGAANTIDDARAVDLSEADRTLSDLARRALSATGYSTFRQIDVEICRGTVLLWGRVPTYHLKQVAQWCVQQVAGVRGVANGLEVVCARSYVP